MSNKTWQDIETGFIVKPGGAKRYRTGDWRSQWPDYIRERCIRCGVCYVFCPDMAISILKDGYVEFSDYYCKGCGICARECPTGAIKMVKKK